MKPIIELKDKHYLIVGASGGIGMAVSELISEQGGVVDIVARHKDSLDEVISHIGGKHKAWVYDVTDLDEIDTWMKELTRERGPFDGMVYCVGTDQIRPLRMLSYDKLENIMRVNYYPFIEIVRSFEKKNNSKDAASVVAISSIASFEGGGGKTAYCASKGAIDSSVRALAKDLSVRHIRVNSVCPGMVDTDLLKRIDSESEEFRRGRERQFLGLIKPRDVANVVAFLLGDSSKMITGQSFVIDGGRTCCS